MQTTLLLALLTAAAASGAAAAQAATLTVDRPCVRPAQPIGFTGGGFAADESVRLLLGTQVIDAFSIGPGGGYAGRFQAPGLGAAARLSQVLTLTNDYGTTATVKVIVTGIGAAMKPAKAAPARVVTFRPFGFVEGGTIYAHYARTTSGTAHRLVKTVRLGALKGPCGDGLFTVRQLPLARPRPGRYEIQFDTSRAYHRRQGVYAERTVLVAGMRG